MKTLLQKNIDSVHQLEVLLLLRRYSDRGWLAREIARELYTEPLAVADELKRLEKLGFLTCVSASNPLEDRYRYQAATPELDTVMTDLSEAYRSYRFRVIDAIFATPEDHIKHFSDAFKFRKEGEK